ncbi:CDP-glycerol glycerophosphotransferase family protein [Ornithinibacillus xuwenensis]|uniref:CDP-glycerol glycerophosphotransferase family protein n=1 Tax=Ornithinibacillus xuwenensis TaxID=3144668 RepID=A0ABU9XGF0_9BACI
MKQLRLLPTILVKYGLRAAHGIFSLIFKVKDQKITFASYRSNELKDNLYYVSEEFKEKHPSYNRVYLLRKFDSSTIGKMKYLIHLLKSCFHIATSRYFIIDDYYFPIYVIKPRKQAEIIQLWHSSGALKKFGLSTVGKPFGPSSQYLKHVSIHGNYSKAYVSSREVIPYFAEAFGMEKEKIKPLGVPRTDYFYMEDLIEHARERLYKWYPSLFNKKLILYAPTFRGKSHYQDNFELPFDTAAMESAIGKEYALLVHLHPYMKSELNYEENSFVYNIEEGFTIQELLGVTDILITDYSTVFFDYSLLNRPIIFYSNDLEDYKNERDFYYDYEALIPGPIISNTDALINIIQNNDFKSHDIENFANRFFDYQDGFATQRIVSDILQKTK